MIKRKQKMFFRMQSKHTKRNQMKRKTKSDQIKSKKWGEPNMWALTCEKHKSLLRLVNEPNGCDCMWRHCWMHVLNAYATGESHTIFVVSGWVSYFPSCATIHGHAAANHSRMTTAPPKPAHSGAAHAMMQSSHSAHWMWSHGNCEMLFSKWFSWHAQSHSSTRGVRYRMRPCRCHRSFPSFAILNVFLAIHSSVSTFFFH